jgi:hypothetical protein
MGAGSDDFAGQLSLGVSTAAGEFVFRSAGTAEFTLFGPAESVGDFAVLYGRRRSGARGWLRAAAGPALVESVRRGGVSSCALFFCDYEMETERAVGLAVQVDATWAVARWFGLGASVFADANSNSSFVGATLNVLFGRVR